MRQQTFSPPRATLGQARTAQTASSRKRILLIAGLLSVGVHVVVALLIVFLPHVLPAEPHPQEQGTVELLMVEQKGTTKTETNTQPADKPAEATPAKAEAPKKQADAPAPVAAPLPPVAEDGDQPAAPQREPAPAKSADANAASTTQQAQDPPMQAGSREAPIFNLEGTESESNAVAMGSEILPAMPDNRFRNRPPVYPAEAEMRGQHGAVVILIHVSENGIATGVDVVESSGVEILDQAAVAAVRKWHFHPALKAGSAVPFDMPFRFVFQAY